MQITSSTPGAKGGIWQYPELPQYIIQNAQLSTKKLQDVQINRKVWPIHREKKQTIETDFEGTQMLDLDKNFKTIIISISKN